MRHGDKINNLGRTKPHREALLRNLASALITHKRITTTLPKAKELRKFIEPLITKSKDSSMHSRRVIFSYFTNKEVVKEMFGVVAAKVADRPGGYCRILKTGHRQGDNAAMAMIELVDFNTIYGKELKVATAKKTRRSKAPVKAVVEKDANDTAENKTEE
jgi:large subunit ribosomal protein L17